MRNPNVEELCAQAREEVHQNFSQQVRWLNDLVDLSSHTAAIDDVEKAASFIDQFADVLGLHTQLVAPTRHRVARHRVYSTQCALSSDESDPNGAGGSGSTLVQTKAIALVGHVDTVFPRETRFVSMNIGEDERGRYAHGPGTVDMKGGVSVMFHALRAAIAIRPDLCERLPLRLIIVSDEEIGSPSSRDLYRELAPELAGALVFEAGRDEDKIVVARKGGAMFKIRVTGSAAHAGNDHASGVNALHVLSRLVPRIEALTDYDAGITLNVGMMSGGTAKNTVPEFAEAVVDMRFEAQSDGVACEARIHGLAKALLAEFGESDQEPLRRLAQAKIEIEGGITRPAMEPTEAAHALRLAYERFAAPMGLKVGAAPRSGGGSDANLLSDLGIPCIDGLGPFGKHFHRLTEWCSLESLEKRTAALTAYLLHLADG